MEIYIVTRQNGLYGDITDTPVKAFETKKMAEMFAEAQNSYFKHIMKAVDSLNERDIYYEDVIEKIYECLLRDTNGKFLEDVREVWQNADAAITDDEHEIITRYEDGLFNFTQDPDEDFFKKYARELGYDDETIQTLLTAKPFCTEYNYDLPYYYVERPIELVKN